MSHFDQLRPSYVILVCALVFGLVAAYVGPNGTGFALISCALIGWGIVINARERERDKRYCDNLTSGLADLLRDQEAEMGYRLHMDAQFESRETMHGGKVYHGTFPHLKEQYEILTTDVQDGDSRA